MHIIAPRKWGVVFGKKMSNDLIQSANRFKILLDWEYEFVIGRKGVSRAFIVDFLEDDFHHLIGLHKLKDNDFIRTSKRSKIFQAILSGRLTDIKLKSSRYYQSVKDRIDAFERIVDVLESSPQVFRYSVNRAGSFSKIDADYLVYHIDDRNVYLFLKQRRYADTYACISMFFEDRTDYTKGQARYTLLKLTKRNKATGEKTVVYYNPSYREEDEMKSLN